MRNRKIIFIVVLLFICSSCTQALWKETAPNEYIKIKFTEITEEELKEKGAKYIKDEDKHVYYVEKNSFDKFKDFFVRVLGTPVTLVIDATSVIIFAVAFAIVDNEIDDAREKGCNEDPDCSEKGWYSD